MHVFSTSRELRQHIQQWRRRGDRIALVPTLGNLHRGHLHLVEQATRHATHTVVSIFVNPLQFGAHEDFNRYPRTVQADCQALSALPVAAVFIPDVTDMYRRPLADMTFVEVPRLSDIFCGASRPGHFRGVATIVTKLFNVVQPDVAVFGQKDWQQLLVIRRLTEDLNLPIEIIGVPTVREADGLAMSSRNGYLSAQERQIAPQLYATLQDIAKRLQQGERDWERLVSQATQRLVEVGFRPDYIAIRRVDDLAMPQAADTQFVILAAAYLGQTRLIDNIVLA